MTILCEFKIQMINDSVSLTCGEFFYEITSFSAIIIHILNKWFRFGISEIGDIIDFKRIF